MARTVRGPDGRTWRVRRRWLHHKLVWRGSKPDAEDTVDAISTADWLRPSLVDADDLAGIFFVIGVWVTVGVAATVLVLFFFPALMLLLDIVLFVVVVGGGLIGKFVLRRPWTIEAVEIATSRATGPARTWKVSGWRASNAAIDRIADHLEAGAEPTP